MFRLYTVQMSTHAHSLYPVLFETLSNNSDEVVIQGLTVLAEIVNSTNPSKDATSSHSHYKKFLNSLLRLFDEKRPLLENRGAFIIRLGTIFKCRPKKMEFCLYLHILFDGTLQPIVYITEC